MFITLSSDVSNVLEDESVAYGEARGILHARLSEAGIH